MKSESLVNIKTFRDIKNDVEKRGERKIKTTNSLSKTEEELEAIDSIVDDKDLDRALEKERQRFARQDLAIKRVRKKLIAARIKLAKMVNKNRKVTELRHQLQKERGKREDPPQKIKRTSKSTNFKEVDIGY
jgi:hypothetical protein